MRHTKNQAEPDFTDQELLTTYLFSLTYERRFRVKDTYDYIFHHWLDCFPALPSYTAYNARLNRLASVFPVLAELLLAKYSNQADNQSMISLTDSMPIITCKGNRVGKVARELCDKGYNSTKKMYFYGVKLHGIGFHRKGALPIMEFLQLGPASEHDLQAQRQLLGLVPNRIVFGDKAFSDKKLKELFIESGGELITPIKYKKGQPLEDKQRHKTADDLYSRAVSKTRQPIESFFNWLIEHTDIQRAAKVRSLKGLLVHIFGRIAASLLKLKTFSS
ncbi:MAG: transposase [Aureispira sp.]|nr:transposase [Aureispira sp.]